MRTTVWRISIGGILAAIIFVATYVIAFPIPQGTGYINFGDGCILAAAALIGPYAGISAAIGSGLADLLAWPAYVLPTVLIKGGIGLIAGLVLQRRPKLLFAGQLTLFALCELLMVGGYFLTDLLFFGFSKAWPSVPMNAIQGLAGVVFALAVVPLLRRIQA